MDFQEIIAGTVGKKIRSARALGSEVWGHEFARFSTMIPEERFAATAGGGDSLTTHCRVWRRRRRGDSELPKIAAYICENVLTSRRCQLFQRCSCVHEATTRYLAGHVAHCVVIGAETE